MSPKSFFSRNSTPPHDTQTIRLSLFPVFRAKNANAWQVLTLINFDDILMPFDNRRIAGPEETQPVVFRREKCNSKPLVTTGMYFLNIISVVCNFNLFSYRYVAKGCETMAGKWTNFVQCVSWFNRSISWNEWNDPRSVKAIEAIAFFCLKRLQRDLNRDTGTIYYQMSYEALRRWAQVNCGS